MDMFVQISHRSKFLTSQPILSSLQKQNRLQTSASTASLQRESITRVRIRLVMDKCDRQEPIMNCLTSDCGLTVNINNALFEVDRGTKHFNLELIGTTAQIQSGLTYLNSLNLKIQGRANVDGDSWYY